MTIFSVMEGRVIARCQGHSSFVSSVAFDPVRTDKRSYRFGSVGEDNKLILVTDPSVVVAKLSVISLHSGISRLAFCTARNYR